MSRDEFERYWLTKHATVVKTFPEVKRYVVNLFVGPGAEAAPYDGFAELWYDDAKSLEKLSSSELVREFIESDNPKFQDLATRCDLFVEEHVIKS